MKVFRFVVLVSVFVFTGCQPQLSEEKVQEYTEKGNKVAQSTFKALSTQLMNQMQEGGPVQAVDFCNVNALKLTSAMSTVNGAEVKRTSDKIRNAANAPTSREAEVIADFQKLMEAGKELQPVVEKEGTQVHYYAPIKLQAACLNCHGNETQVSVADSILKVKYPADKALNYKEGDLRGIWSITFEETK